MKEKVVAVLYGFACHAVFMLAVVVMAHSLFWGLSNSFAPIGGSYGRLINLLLLVQFPIIHSALLTDKGRHFLSRMAPFGLGRDLTTTIFSLIASLQLLAVFLFWTPSQQIWYLPKGWPYVFSLTLYCAAWAFLIKALHDAGLALQSGFLGWGSVVRGRKPQYGSFPRKGLFRNCRQPVYLGFLLVLVFAPVWTLDHLIMLSLWGAYCFFGPKLKERRFLKWYGNGFKEYQENVPYFLPSISACKTRRS
ncbi:MAG: isoprenylcysteine carboxylmethyltransferase family protein [Deltaproteobacteria bacterium]|nr:isoprenylcysteine carboxylmethyltransferase family protein [Deltaproteobacteria bacterium]